MTDDTSADASPHRPIMVVEVLAHLRPAPGDIVVDCTLGGGGHASAILPRLHPGGRLIGLDVDPVELPATAARLRRAGFGPETFIAELANFRALPAVLAGHGLERVDGVLVDLGVSSMQHDTPARGFSYKHPGPLDLRMDPTRGVPAWQRLATLDPDSLEGVLREHADEPHANLIARLLVDARPATTHALERIVRLGITTALPAVPRAEVKMSVRRTFQALRIMVNDELAALDALLAVLPGCLAPGGRVVVLTFHSGEDRRVKHAFRHGRTAGLYAEASETVVRSARDETFANRRAASAKLRWAVRASQ
jgi:16S rRNA (cytosine1402-N4)-methyltransferase